jgi:hypothetical protein
VPRLKNPSLTIWGHVSQIKKDWSPMLLRLQRLQLHDYQLLPWDYPIRNTVISLLDLNNRVVLPQRPLSTLLDELHKQRLQSYIDIRGLKWQTQYPNYLITPSSIKEKVILSALSKIMGDGGFNLKLSPTLKKLQTWTSPASKNLFHLYQIGTY